MASRIKRGGKGVRRSAAAQSRNAKARKARARTGSALDTAMGVLPFTYQQWQRIWTAIIIGGAAALAWFVASVAGVPAMAEAGDSKITFLKCPLRGQMNISLKNQPSSPSLESSWG